MAGIDIRTSLPAQALTPQRTSSQRLEAAREAQRAFFNAALAGDMQAAPAHQPAAQTQATTPSARAPAADIHGNLRPGSIVDIKV